MYRGRCGAGETLRSSAWSLAMGDPNCPLKAACGQAHVGQTSWSAAGDWPFTGVCVPDGQSAFRKAAERRQTVAHGASRGYDVRIKRKPRQGRQSWRSAPCSKLSVAPPGLACGAPGNPRLTPWATFLRRSAPPEYASAVRRASILYSQNGQSPGADLLVCRLRESLTPRTPCQAVAKEPGCSANPRDWPFSGACVPDGQSAFREAAERRQIVAHGTSRGDGVRTKR